MTIGDRIKQRRLELSLSADELGKRIGKNRATIYRYESNDIENLPTTVVPLLAKALDTTPAYIMGWSDSLDGKANYTVHVEVNASNKNEAIFIAVKNMLIANGDIEKANQLTEDEAVKLYTIAGFDIIQEVEKPTSLAAHFDGSEYTEDELNEIRQFAEFVKNKRKS